MDNSKMDSIHIPVLLMTGLIHLHKRNLIVNPSTIGITENHALFVSSQVEHKSELTEYNARGTESVARATLRDVIMVDKGLFSVSSLEIMCEVGLSAEDLNVQKIQYEIVTQGKHKRDELIAAGSEKQDKKLR